MSARCARPPLRTTPHTPEQHVKNEIRTILKHVAHLEAAIDSIGDGDDLYEAGLSSLDTIQLMLAIEKQFNIEIPDEMLNRNLFRSVDALADTIATLQRAEHSA
ncbi:acyl carrier protein [Burkholderia sp. Bp8994]|nr:acyl carrier protein [Burkholderia sp. Bp9131]RQR79842.1 acyl carrier protein [Burkholderia sp. Bp9015]RQR90452.1 acyl carrier protein [Burkholderia sp. Bp9011]RQR99458.1 acyl carrier protein [Burkholderia sp. Bp9010]RQS01736.1 acyl carrier protein [Burkholderia sp. Bp8994]RQS13445.1 acyl carrier protein [Burkholderia sp. Bp8991]RQS35014.1 acyl carrier protein [Burkholderia sp. Bp8995]RQS45338.1 acyl carrier protein [Burkholderia sp. Bp8990]RQS52260.1 acyl carrier protein [Burkholderia s